MLTFFAQDHASSEMVYANADLTRAEQARGIIAFADYWHATTGVEPGLLVFDSQLTNYDVLKLTERGQIQDLRQSGGASPPPHVTNDTVTVDLNLRTYHPTLIDAGFVDLDLPTPWLDNRRLRLRFPPR